MASDTSYNTEEPINVGDNSEMDVSMDDDCHSDSSQESSDDPNQENSDSSILGSDKEFGPESTRLSEVDDLVELPSVPTFKERVGKVIGRFLNDAQKFCVSGKMAPAPTISVSLAKVQKFISFPLYDEMLDSIISEFEQPSAFGRGKGTAVDTNLRNSWELSCNEFEIMNTEWNSYLIDVLIPLLQHDLRLEVGFRLSLHKLLLHRTGSFFEQHRDSEKENGVFGTVIIQLPSIYEGGKTIVRHNKRTEEVDTSSTTTSQNGFSMFYTAFYCDCEHEVLPITGGVRACLVYNLVLTSETQSGSLPSAARLEREYREGDLVDLLRDSWLADGKLVYCLANKYSQKNLSFHNLKSTDRLVGDFFLKYADSCGLKVMIGVLKRKKFRYAQAVYKPEGAKTRSRREPNYMNQNDLKSEYDFQNWHYYDSDDDSCEIATISDVNSNDPAVTFYDDYKVKHLQSLNSEQRSNLPSLHVDFEREVLPENCFQNVKVFHKDQNMNDSKGVECSKYYQCAAVVIFRRADLMPVLLKGDAKLSKIEETFLKEFKQQKDKLTNEEVKAKLVKWSHAIIDRFCSRWSYADNKLRKMPEMLECFLMLGEIELLKKFLKVQRFEEGQFACVYKMCEKLGWKTFSADIISVFDKLKTEQQIVNLQKFIDYKETADTERQSIIHKLLYGLLTKFEYELDNPPRKSWHKYQPRPLKKDRKTFETKKMLISVWPLADKVNFTYIVEYAKSKPMNIGVPVLIAVAKDIENVRENPFWMDIVNHFKPQMKNVLNKPVESTWKQNVKLNCKCKHCKIVNGFLQQPSKQTFDFFGKKPIRNHVQVIINRLENLTLSTPDFNVLRIKKLKKTDEDQPNDDQKLVSANLKKLNSLCRRLNKR